jgi:hypothetical protein
MGNIDCNDLSPRFSSFSVFLMAVPFHLAPTKPKKQEIFIGFGKSFVSLFFLDGWGWDKSDLLTRDELF